MYKIVPGLIVQHFKRETYDLSQNPTICLYKILGIGTHTENGEKLVVYQSLYSTHNIKFGQVFCRPYDMFCSLVDTRKYPDIKQKYRFEVFKGQVR